MTVGQHAHPAAARRLPFQYARYQDAGGIQGGGIVQPGQRAKMDQMPASLARIGEVVRVKEPRLQQPASRLAQRLRSRLVAGQQPMQQRTFDPGMRRDQAGAAHLAAEEWRQIATQMPGNVHGLPANSCRIGRKIDRVDIGQMPRGVPRPDRPTRIAATQEFAVAAISRVVFVVAPRPAAFAIPVAEIELPIGAVVFAVVVERLQSLVGQFVIVGQGRIVASADGGKARVLLR